MFWDRSHAPKRRTQGRDRRRRHPRVEVHLPVFCRLTGREGRPLSLLGKAWDLSVSGMRISLGGAFKPTSPILDYDLRLPAPFAQLCGNGRIRWVQWEPFACRTTFGLEFQSLTEAQRSDLGTILDELSRPTPAWPRPPPIGDSC